MHTTYFILAILLLFASCKTQVESNYSLRADEYEIYSMIIDNYYPPLARETVSSIGIYYETIVGEWVESKTLCVVQRIGNKWVYTDSTSKDASSILRRFSTSGDYNSTDSSFVVNSTKGVTFDSAAFHLRSRHRLVQADKRGWINIPPDSTLRGVVMFSRIGFDTKRTEALVFFVEGRDEGLSMNLLLKKVDSRWEIINGICK